MFKLISFGIKAGLVGGTIYYTNELGVWEDVDHSSKVAQQVRQAYHQYVNPYVKDVKTSIPLEVPAIPSLSNIEHYLGSSWNSGVLVTFKFLSNLPTNLKQLSTDASNFIQQQINASVSSSNNSTSTETSK